EGHGSSPLRFHRSKEFSEAHQRAHKEYIRKLGDLVEADTRMMKTKKFKAVSDAAEREEESAKTEDWHQARMRSLHTTYVVNKGKSLRPSSEDSLAGGASTARTPRKEVRMANCALCQRESPLDKLPGSVKRSTLQKLLERNPHSRARKDLLPPVAPKQATENSDSPTQ
ncbi:unnamed protein product, partial [Polarella glacialis]